MGRARRDARHCLEDITQNAEDNLATVADANGKPNENNNDANGSGAVYMYRETSSGWEQQAYIKASNTGTSDYFGFHVSLSNDGSYLAVSATQEDSNTTGINGDGTDNSASASGAAYVYRAD